MFPTSQKANLYGSTTIIIIYRNARHVLFTLHLFTKNVLVRSHRSVTILRIRRTTSSRIACSTSVGSMNLMKSSISSCSPTTPQRYRRLFQTTREPGRGNGKNWRWSRARCSMLNAGFGCIIPLKTKRVTIGKKVIISKTYWGLIRWAGSRVRRWRLSPFRWREWIPSPSSERSISRSVSTCLSNSVGCKPNKEQRNSI